MSELDRLKGLSVAVPDIEAVGGRVNLNLVTAWVLLRMASGNMAPQPELLNRLMVAINYAGHGRDTT